MVAVCVLVFLAGSESNPFCTSTLNPKALTLLTPDLMTASTASKALTLNPKPWCRTFGARCNLNALGFPCGAQGPQDGSGGAGAS